MFTQIYFLRKTKAFVLVVICLFFTNILLAGHRKHFLSHGPSVAAFGRGETAVSNYDDVSSVFYNPALAANLASKSATLTHYSLSEGSMYNFAGFGMPVSDKSFGAVSLINLRSGDVEIRKTIIDNPTVINTNQWAALFSFASKLDNFYDINAGGALRIIYMDLYGYTDTGYGIDAGLTKEFKGPYLFGNKSVIETGFSAQNFISPSIKLVSCEETYPLLCRFGGALKVPTVYHAFSYDELMFAADLIYDDSYLTSAVGLEYTFIRQYAVKCGYYDNHLTVGAGYRITQFRFDYAFDLSDFSDIHRISLSYAFSDISGKKNALLKEAKETLAESEKEKKKREKEAKALIKQAIQYYDKKYYLRSTDLFNEIRLKYPEYETADIYLNKIETEMTTTIKNMDSDMEKLSYANGYIDYYSLQYNNAINEWEKVLQINPKRIELSEYIEKTRNYLLDAERIRKEKEMQGIVKGLFDEGVILFGSSKWISCIKTMEKVKRLCAENLFSESIDYNLKASDYINKSVAKLSESIKKERKEETVVQVESEIDEETAEKHYKEGLVLYAQGKLFEAEKSWELTLRLNPNHIKAQKALKKIREGK